MSQAREKYLSLRKGTKSDIATVLEEVFFNANLTVILPIMAEQVIYLVNSVTYDARKICNAFFLVFQF